jgi:hypothetical protein
VDNAHPHPSKVLPPESLAPARLITGFLQGVFLYLLYQSSETRHWPATEPYP